MWCGSSELSWTPIFPSRCAEAFARAGGKRKWEEIEAELLNGQKLQGPMTSAELMPVIKANKLEKKLPLLCAVHAIAFEGATLPSLYACQNSLKL